MVGTGCFKALSDGTAEVLFVNGVRAQMMWTTDTYTPAQVLYSLKLNFYCNFLSNLAYFAKTP